MCDLLRAFESIDTDHSGAITKEELLGYCRDNGVDMNFVEVTELSKLNGPVRNTATLAFSHLNPQKWLNLFDMDNSGTISIEEYCEVLGLKPNEDYIDKVTEQRAHAGVGAPTDDDDEDVMDGVRIIALDKEMTEDLKRAIVRLARRAQDEFSVEKDIAKYIKTELDSQDQRAWHVIVGRFQYGSYCTHEVGCMFHFFVNRFAILVWRTPDY